MSQENVEIVRSVYEAVKRGDLETAGSLIHPDIEFHTYDRSPEAGVYRGREAVRKYNEERSARSRRDTGVVASHERRHRTS